MAEKNPYTSGSETVQDSKNGDKDLETKPMIAVSVTHGYGPTKYKIFLPPQSTFGDLKKHLVVKTGLQPEEQRLLFRGKQKDDDEHLHIAGVKNLSKILLLEDQTKKQRNNVEDVKEVEEVEEVKISDEVSEASKAIAEVQTEVDKLSDRVAALEIAVNGGTNVAEKEFIVSTELLMRQLLKLDGIDADGEAKLQRKAEVRRVQNFVDRLDALKARNANPISNNHNKGCSDE